MTLYTLDGRARIYFLVPGAGSIDEGAEIRFTSVLA